MLLRGCLILAAIAFAAVALLVLMVALRILGLF